MDVQFVKKNRILATATVGILSLFLLSACSSGKTLVSMKGGKITEEDYYKEIKTESSNESTLQNLIIYKIAENGYGDKVSNAAVNKQYDAMKKSLGTTFSSQLASYGLTESSYKKQIRQGLAFQAMLKAHVKVTNSDLKTAWASFHPTVDAQIIQTSSKEDAEKALKSIKSGKDFGDVAKSSSTDATKSKKGKISFDSSSTTVPDDVKTAAFKLKNGEMSDVLTVSTSSTYGTTESYYIVKMVKNKDKGHSMTPYKKKLTSIVTDTKLSDSTFQQEVITAELKKANVSIKDSELSSILSSFLESSSSSSSSKASSSKTSSTSSTTDSSSTSSTSSSSSK